MSLFFRKTQKIAVADIRGQTGKPKIRHAQGHSKAYRNHYATRFQRVVRRIAKKKRCHDFMLQELVRYYSTFLAHICESRKLNRETVE